MLLRILELASLCRFTDAKAQMQISIGWLVFAMAIEAMKALEPSGLILEASGLVCSSLASRNWNNKEMVL
ncbi:hypothetical protein VNI00_016769 [Paramarasmius palmivorus]|uniref:Uncharacterized protein n=1 Tax=Paramarasmius palmivorus TaxID=297713 RepID=A0AAW0BC91_9AGAR